MSWREDTWFFDTEVLPHDWFLCAKQKTTGETKMFHNQPSRLISWLDESKPLLCGYNSKHYDTHILRVILSGGTPEDVKAMNDSIIVQGLQGWSISCGYTKLPKSYDLMLDLPTKPSLKMIEGNMGMSIKESDVDFNKETLTEHDVNELVFYCFNDVNALAPLWKARLSYLEAKETLALMKGFDVEECLNMTNAKLVAKFLDATYVVRNDERDYVIPGNIDESLIPSKVFNFFNRLHDTSIPLDVLFGKEGVVDEDGNEIVKKSRNPYKKLELDIAGCPHIISWGGLHGARKNFIYKSVEGTKILNVDVTSFYPSIMIHNHFLSRNIADASVFESVFKQRLEAKKNGDKKTADALKLVLNTTYGASNNQYNAMYDPLMAHSVCITGQLYLIELISMLKSSVPSFVLIQSNTDGIMFLIDEKDESLADMTVGEWKASTGFGTDKEEIEAVIQRDVNNYVIRKKDGSVKTKGGVLSAWKGGDFKSASMAIVAKAIVNQLLDKIPVESTILNCNDALMFQIIFKAGSTYSKVIQEYDLTEQDTIAIMR